MNSLSKSGNKCITEDLISVETAITISYQFMDEETESEVEVLKSVTDLSGARH